MEEGRTLWRSCARRGRTGWRRTTAPPLGCAASRSRATGGRRLLRLVAIAAIGSVLLACGGGGGTDVVLTVDEHSIRMDPSETGSGRITFSLDNVGRQEHEVLVVEADDPGALPLLPDGSVDIEAATVVDQLEAVPPGHYEATFLAVPAGEYLLICNIVDTRADGVAVSHFQMGMRLPIRVIQSEEDAPTDRG